MYERLAVWPLVCFVCCGLSQGFAVAQNYVCGSTEVLAFSVKLRTLMLSSNYFGFDAVTLDSADSLGTGTYALQLL